MDDTPNKEQAIQLLQHLGLKEYESKCFVALSRRKQGTAKEISETSEVPRTRVYDAIRVLETKGLVEIQHSNPQVFRAVSIDEAIDIFRSEYEGRMERLRNTLQGLNPVEDDEVDVTHEIWALSSNAGITSRTRRLINDADREIVLVIGHEGVFTGQLTDHLRAARDRGVKVRIGTTTEELRETVRDALPEIESFVSGLEWLGRPDDDTDGTKISRLILVDRRAILVSSYTPSDPDGQPHEQAVFGRGFENGLVAIVRRMMETGFARQETES